MMLPVFRVAVRRPASSILRRPALQQRRCQTSSTKTATPSATNPTSAGVNETTTKTTTDAATTATSSKAGDASKPSSSNPMSRLFQAYTHARETRPYATQVGTVMTIFLAADISAQSIGGKEYDPMRSVRSMIIGAGCAIPQYKWFIWLSKHFNYSSKVASIASKVALNQLVFPPIFGVYFFGCQALLSGDGIEGTITRIKTMVPVQWMNSWKLWPAAMVFTFTFVPLEYRSIFTGVIGVGWQTYLTWLNRQAELKEVAGRDGGSLGVIDEVKDVIKA